MSALRFGVALQNFTTPASSPDIDEILGYATRAEELGLDFSTNEMAAGRHAMMLTGITDTFLFAQRGFFDYGFLGLADYLLPSMTDLPGIEVHHIETLSPLTPLGNKGMGEAGAIGPMAEVGNAVADALDRCVDEVPLTPQRVWKLARRPPREA